MPRKRGLRLMRLSMKLMKPQRMLSVNVQRPTKLKFFVRQLRRTQTGRELRLTRLSMLMSKLKLTPSVSELRLSRLPRWLLKLKLMLSVSELRPMKLKPQGKLPRKMLREKDARLPRLKPTLKRSVSRSPRPKRLLVSKLPKTRKLC